MFNATEIDEREYLKKVIVALEESLATVENEILSLSDGMVESKRYAWENIGTLDKVERAAYKISMNEGAIFAELSISERNRLKKLILSPYFGRVDFAADSEKTEQPYYLGIHSFCESKGGKELIIDWRAPLSSIFYDYETGFAEYNAPEGTIAGEIIRKRQYHIRDSKMDFMLENTLNIDDDILQKELSRTSDEKMKSIVATIQKEQNKIIRNEDAKVLIIQGAAGSGKTSIALHRVAFLLYRYKHSLKAEDMLVLSPNKVFGNYISNILPELGEDNIPQLGFEDLARFFLGKKCKFQTFAEQVSDLIDNGDEAKINRIAYKASNEFVVQLKAFLSECEKNGFVATDLKVENFSVSRDTLVSEYWRLRKMPIKKRLEKIAADTVASHERIYAYTLSPPARKAVKERVARMFLYPTALSMYKHFFSNGRQDMLVITKGQLEFCDVFPLAWLTLHYDGAERRYSEIRHLLVDEMQDYTPIQYAFLSELFPCRMTILGDSHQGVNPYTSTSIAKISPYFDGCECIELRKSYRSTVEILNFVQTIRKNENIIPIERHGEEPALFGCKSFDDEISCIKRQISEFRTSQYRSLGIICKSQRQALRLFKEISQDDAEIKFINFDTDEFFNGVVVTFCHMSKGLEFDWVIVPECCESNYQTEHDRSLLYIACTRAMHVLGLTFSGQQSKLIAPGTIWYQ